MPSALSSWQLPALLKWPGDFFPVCSLGCRGINRVHSSLLAGLRFWEVFEHGSPHLDRTWRQALQRGLHPDISNGKSKTALGSPAGNPFSECSEKGSWVGGRGPGSISSSSSGSTDPHLPTASVLVFLPKEVTRSWHRRYALYFLLNNNNHLDHQRHSTPLILRPNFKKLLSYKETA